MRINFIGLSCFLIENQSGHTILVDPFDDVPEWRLGPIFPKEIGGKSLGANLILMSEPDADHARAPGGLLQNAPETKPNSNPFPNLNLKGTIVYEHNGDLNIAWHYTVDDLRLAHFADNAHLLTDEQLNEIGNPDIIFISPPKAESTTGKALEITRKNIERLKPKIIVWAHHIAPKNLPKDENPETLRKFFVQYFSNNASTNMGYQDGNTFISLCYVLENAILLNKEYSGIILTEPFIEINRKMIEDGKLKTTSILFKTMVAGSTVE